MSLDIYAMITDRIIAALEQGTVPWHKPWTGGEMRCISYSTGKPYSFLNCILLGCVSGEYITYNQAVSAGGHVKAGEKSRIVVFWKPIEKEDPDTGEKKPFFVLRYYNVFHISQCENIEPRWRSSCPAPGSDLQPNEYAEEIIQDYLKRSGVKLTVTQSNNAFYRPYTDEVVIPQLSQYKHVAEYYSTCFHELTHSTGHPSRLNRLTEDAGFGSETYSAEELVAELGSAFLVNRVGLETDECFNNSAAYIAGWLSVLKNDKRMIVTAAGKAEKATKLILNETENGAPV